MFEEVKLDAAEADRVKGIIAEAFEEMATVSTGIGGHAANFGAAYTGGGTARGMETYESLGRAGQALAEALNGLSQDLGLTANTGRETDAEAEGAVNQVTVHDPRIAAAI
ncbi:hypothetical protein [Streptomyces millisiae]|uniref:WXG100 family type VII secretion target n=1 Tax=Streptomyces millisiae TaxID=3075542 RepID=A0ABU2LUF2_9ACTN|nr:hypothetical protein [Streptomyces sp. DSM 44918]MDT0321155.1 hypothetical protein [Streptomyces sp. DSM 44918]